MGRLLMGASKQRERVIQIRMQTAAERATMYRLNNEFQRVAEAAADAFEVGGTMDPVMSAHQASMESILSGTYDDVINRFGTRIINAGKKLAPDLIETKDSEGELQRAVRRYIESIAPLKVQQVTETTLTDIRETIRDATDEGLGAVETGRLIRQRIGEDISRIRSETIARTEVHGAAQYGQQEGAKSLHVGGMLKGWLDAADGRERETHAEAGFADPIPMEEAFSVGGYALDFPGDPNGPAEEVVNCRCGQYFEIPD